jgi:hypothetical protein
VPAGSGGSGGGGNGYSGSGVGIAGTANTGGGGGGSAGDSTPGSTGGSGVVILSVPIASYNGNYTGPATTGTNGSNTWIKWTGSGTYTA